MFVENGDVELHDIDAATKDRNLLRRGRERGRHDEPCGELHGCSCRRGPTIIASGRADRRTRGFPTDVLQQRATAESDWLWHTSPASLPEFARDGCSVPL